MHRTHSTLWAVPRLADADGVTQQPAVEVIAPAARWVRAPDPHLGALYGDGSDPVQFIDVRNLAEWTIREARTTGVFNASGPTPLSPWTRCWRRLPRPQESISSLSWRPRHS